MSGLIKNRGFNPAGSAANSGPIFVDAICAVQLHSEFLRNDCRCRIIEHSVIPFLLDGNGRLFAMNSVVFKNEESKSSARTKERAVIELDNASSPR